MKIRKTWRALLAAVLCLTLLGGLFAAAAEEIALEEGPAVEGDALALELEETDALDPELPDLDLDLALDADLALPAESVEPVPAPAAETPDDEIVLGDGVQSNGEAAPNTAVADPIPLAVSYSGGALTKVYDGTNKGASSRDGQTVYTIPELRTIKSRFTLAPASGKSWVDGHRDVGFRLVLSKQFSSANVGSYTFTFRLELTGADAGYYTLPEATVSVPAAITPRPVTVTPRTGLGKAYRAAEPAYKPGTWLSKSETSPLHQDVGNVPLYGVPIVSEDGRAVLGVEDRTPAEIEAGAQKGYFLALSARQNGTKLFPGGWLSREPGEEVGRYKITLGSLSFGNNFTITLKEEYFTITRRAITDADVTVSIPDAYYTGKALKPAVSARCNGYSMAQGRDFTVTYSNNKNLGVATATLTGRGSYTGARTAAFNIVLKPTSLSRLTPSKKGRVKVAWKKAGNTSGYQVSYSLNADFSKAVTKKVKGFKKTSLTVKGLKAKRIYYFRVRAWKTVKGKTHYSPWSKVKSVKTK